MVEKRFIKVTNLDGKDFILNLDHVFQVLQDVNERLVVVPKDPQGLTIVIKGNLDGFLAKVSGMAD